MKLIRLYTSGDRLQNGNLTTCSFNNNLQDNLILPPFSKIAFLNASIDTMEYDIKIDSTNNKLWYSLDSGVTKEEVTVTQGTYAKSQFKQFLTILTNNFNDSVYLIEGTEGWLGYVGVQWLVSIKLFKVNIEFKRSVLQSYENRLNFVGTDIDFDEDFVAVFNNTTYESTDFTEVAMLGTPLAQGFGTIRAQIDLLVSSGTHDFTNNGFVVGLSTTNLSTIAPEDFTQSMITYGIKVSAHNDNNLKYFTFLNGVITEETRTVGYIDESNTLNDYLDVSINGSNVEIGVYSGFISPEREILRSHAYTSGQNLYPFIAFNTGSEYTVASNLAMTPDPFSPLPPPVYVADDFLLSVPPVPPTPSSGVAELNFQSIDGVVESDDLGKYLGYDDLSLTSGISVVEHSFVAQTNFQGASVANSFIVELQNIQLESYDGFKEGRKNILYFMSTDTSNGSLHFEVNTPQPIDLNNKNEILLRNIRARILDDNYTPILIDSPAYMTMIVS